MLDVERVGDRVTLRLNRPEVGNALNGELVARMLDALAELRADPSVRALIVTGAGKVFSAGADLNWMARMEQVSKEENLRDAEQTGLFFASLYDFPRPVIARVNGSARGGGVGLIAACDFAIASNKANFAFTEVRVGVIPALISPFVLRKMGESRTRRLFLTGETFSADQAVAWNLLDRSVLPEDLDPCVNELLAVLQQCSPEATAKIKELLRSVRDASTDEATQITARMIAEIRATPEAREGMTAFLEKRLPHWAESKGPR
jgi:methylglutaconyl-CoA hydratase